MVTNDGTTMRIMAQKNATPSAWTRQKEVIEAKPATAVLEENARRAKAEVALIEEALAEEADAAGEGTCRFAYRARSVASCIVLTNFIRTQRRGPGRG